MRDQVMGYLDRNGWKYDASHQDVIRCAVKLECRLHIVDMRIYFNDFGYSILDFVRTRVDLDRRDEVMRYITMANFRLRSGCFEIDLRDGTVSFRVYTHYRGLVVIPDDIIAESVLVPLSTIDRYGDGLFSIMLEGSDADTEIARMDDAIAGS